MMEQTKELGTAGSGEEKEIVVFEGHPLGKLGLEFVKKPKVLEKRYHSHRRKSDTEVEYVLSPDKYSYRLAVFRWHPEEMAWTELQAEELSL